MGGGGVGVRWSTGAAHIPPTTKPSLQQLPSPSSSLPWSPLPCPPSKSHVVGLQHSRVLAIQAYDTPMSKWFYESTTHHSESRLFCEPALHLILVYMILPHIRVSLGYTSLPRTRSLLLVRSKVRQSYPSILL